MNWTEFFHMGGYAFYVWTSWGLTALVLLWQYLRPKRQNATIRREIKRQIVREEKFSQTGADNASLLDNEPPYK